MRGMFGELIDRAVTNRAAVGGMLVFTFVSALIVANALFFQQNHHPAPLFATRAMPAAPAVEQARTDPIAHQVAEAPLHGDAVGSIPAAPEPASSQPDIAALVDADAALVTDLQRALTASGYYDGAVDGIYGSHTKAAIAAYQTAVGLAADGLPSQALLARLSNDGPTEAMPPIPHPAPDRATPGSPDLAQVQTALNTIGYGPVATDGRLGQETANAIRRFELDNGMDLTGQPNQAVIGKLIDIGAMQPDR